MNNRIVTSLCVLCAVLTAIQRASAQGPLTPPGPPAPTMLTLNQVEPRTPITNIPYTISQPGSYYVTTNLSGSAGITISAGDVTLDLMGFALVGGYGDGIFVSGSCSNLAVRNGIVRNWSPGSGINAYNAVNSLFVELRAANNGQCGIWTGNGCSVLKSVATGNGAAGGFGIFAGSGCLVADCSLMSNNGGGVSVGGGSTVRSCAAQNNGIISGQPGISLGSGCAALNCSVLSNSVLASIHFAGLSTLDGCTLKNCAVYGSSGDGISVGSANTIQNCSSVGNTGNGINLVYANTIEDCTAKNNGYSGIEAQSSNLIRGNECDGNGAPSRNQYAGISLDVYGGPNAVWNYLEDNLSTYNYRGISIHGQNNIVVHSTFAGNSAGNINYIGDVFNTPQFIGQSIKTNDLESDQIFINNTSNPWANFEIPP